MTRHMTPDITNYIITQRTHQSENSIEIHLFLLYHLDHNQILHIIRQLHNLGMCKSVLWLDLPSELYIVIKISMESGIPVKYRSGISVRLNWGQGHGDGYMGSVLKTVAF